MTNAERQKKIDSMRIQLMEMRKRTEAALKKSQDQLKIEEKKYQQEMADFQKKYGE